MNPSPIRDLDEARLLLAQGLRLQRTIDPEPRTVRLALQWAHELMSQGHPLPPIGFVADVGHIALGLGEEDRAGRQIPKPPGLPPHLLSSYEDHVLGKFYADWTLT